MPVTENVKHSSIICLRPIELLTICKTAQYATQMEQTMPTRQMEGRTGSTTITTKTALPKSAPISRPRARNSSRAAATSIMAK